jgi:hypothetical protein
MKTLFKKEFVTDTPPSPYFAVFSFVLATFFLGTTISLTDYRYALKTHEMELDTTARVSEYEPLWFAVSLDSAQNIRIINQDRSVFILPLHLDNLALLQGFENYLHGKVKKIIQKAAIHGEMPQIRAVLAVDESLRYSHLKPILYALSQAHIDNYGFETRLKGSL